MTPKLATLILAFNKLSPAEKIEFIGVLDEQPVVRRGVSISNEEYYKSLAINFGPAPGKCEICGK